MTIAVKNVKRVLSLLIAITVLLSFTAFADVAITNPATHTVGVSENITVTVTGATSGEEVALLIYKDSVTSENILYVDQKTATGSSVAFEFGIRSGFDVKQTYIVKAGSTNSNAAATGSLVFDEITVNGIKITSNPTKTVYANGETFSTAGLAVQEAVDGVANGTAIEAADYTVSEVDTSTAGAKLVVVTSGDYSDTFAIFVQPAVTPLVAVSGISDATSSVTVDLEGNTTLTPTVAPANASEKSVNWVSLDPSVATVANGVVTGVAIGDTKVIAITVDGGFIKAYDVRVKAVTPANGLVGKIVEADNTSVGIAGATVKIYDENAEELLATATTDAYGDYAVALEDGFYFITIEADGYASRKDFDVYAEVEGLTEGGVNGYFVMYPTLVGDVDGSSIVDMDDVFAVLDIANEVTDYPTFLEYEDVE